jgi:hypothetical protein
VQGIEAINSGEVGVRSLQEHAARLRDAPAEAVPDATAGWGGPGVPAEAVPDATAGWGGPGVPAEAVPDATAGSPARADGRGVRGSSPGLAQP